MGVRYRKGVGYLYKCPKLGSSGDIVVNLGPFARKVYDAMVSLGCNSEDACKSADQIMEKAKMGKGQINTGLMELIDKGVVKRIAKSKRAGYYIAEPI